MMVAISLAICLSTSLYLHLSTYIFSFLWSTCLPPSPSIYVYTERWFYSFVLLSFSQVTVHVISRQFAATSALRFPIATSFCSFLPDVPQPSLPAPPHPRQLLLSLPSRFFLSLIILFLPRSVPSSPASFSHPFLLFLLFPILSGLFSVPSEASVLCPILSCCIPPTQTSLSHPFLCLPSFSSFAASLLPSHSLASFSFPTSFTY